MISDEQIDELLAAARSVRERAYAPYSRFRVGAAVLAGGRIYVGANIENASYSLMPASSCSRSSSNMRDRPSEAASRPGDSGDRSSRPVSAPRTNAVAAAVIAGERRIDAVAVSTDEGEPTPPCGGCRQVLNEFGPAMHVISEGADAKRADWSLSELLPHAFGPEDLGVDRPT